MKPRTNIEPSADQDSEHKQKEEPAESNKDHVKIRTHSAGDFSQRAITYASLNNFFETELEIGSEK